MSKNLSPAELYADHFQHPEPRFFTQVPNIIDHLTYTVKQEGITKKKRLSVYAKELYRVIRMIASDAGKCWNSTEALAEKIGCSKSKVSEATQELLMPMDQLDGKPLIIITERKMKKTLDSGHIYGVKYFVRTIVDIWGYNNAFMATLKYQNKYGQEEPVHKEISCSHGEQVITSCSHGEQVPPSSCSLSERNNNPIKKNPLLSKQQPTADAAPVCSSNMEKKKKRLSLSEDQRKSYEWMLKEGCDEKSAFDMASKFSPEHIKLACEYVLKQEKISKSKNKKIFNPWGYFIQTLNGRYWENGK